MGTPLGGAHTSWQTPPSLRIAVHCMFPWQPAFTVECVCGPQGCLLFENGGAVLLCAWAKWPSVMYCPPLLVQHFMAGHHIGT